MSSNSFARLIIDAMRQGGVDVSLSEVINAFELPLDDILGSSLTVIDKLADFQLYLEPDYRFGDLHTRRVLAGKQDSVSIDIKTLLEKHDESSSLELKGSMFCDLNRLKNTGEAHKSDAVVHSVLKTLCGFANADGGVLIIGVSDEKTITGLQNDLACGIASFDKWQLEFSSYIRGRFFNGAAFEPYIKVKIISVDGLSVAHVQVIARNELTFIKSEDGKRYEYYYRSGNKTEQITIELFKEHLIHKNSTNNSSM